jgi:hypothetical protein
MQVIIWKKGTNEKVKVFKCKTEEEAERTERELQKELNQSDFETSIDYIN